MIGSGGSCAVACPHLHGANAISDGDIAELVVIITPPCPETAICLQRQSVRIPCHHLAEASAHPHGAATVSGGAIAKLAVEVVPPGP